MNKLDGVRLLTEQLSCLGQGGGKISKQGNCCLGDIVILVVLVIVNALNKLQEDLQMVEQLSPRQKWQKRDMDAASMGPALH